MSDRWLTGFWSVFKTSHTNLASLRGVTETKHIIVTELTFFTDTHA
jgi:hypothetical protein